MLLPLLGIGFTPAIFAIFLRALLPIVKNAYVGLSEVDEVMIDAARGIGLTEWEYEVFMDNRVYSDSADDCLFLCRFSGFNPFYLIPE
ncbi:hypothetical protein [Palaeococcus sp. (in: euryarchaeotes)]